METAVLPAEPDTTADRASTDEGAVDLAGATSQIFAGTQKSRG
jgi:hypothetical protein